MGDTGDARTDRLRVRDRPVPKHSYVIMAVGILVVPITWFVWLVLCLITL